MQESLKIRIQIGHHVRSFTISDIHISEQVQVSISTVLRLINQFLREINYNITEYLNIWVVSKTDKENIFKLKRKGIPLRLISSQQGQFQISILLQDVGEKGNVLRHYQQNIDHFNRLNNNINRMIVDNKQEQLRNKKDIRTIDIAYFFADPLVQYKNNEIKPKYQVSYQREYQKFIEMIKEQKFGSNLRIQMLAATQANIKNTLIDGVSIMHFACHGTRNGINVQKDRPVGEETQILIERFLNILENKVLPKLIVFNACFSNRMAQEISKRKKIITIGYNKQANDEWCQFFTKQFYKELFKDKTSVRTLFHKIKQTIVKTVPKEGNKLEIFPATPIQGDEEGQIIQSTEQNRNWVQKWTWLQSMREKDPMGVKTEIYNFIKNLLTRNDRSECVYLLGEPNSGKTLLMKKIRIYVMNRKVFTEDLVINLKQKDEGVKLDSMLRFRLERDQSIDNEIQQLKEMAKDRSLRLLVILDHFDKIIKYQYRKLMAYIQTKFINKFKNVKLVVVCNKTVPKTEEAASQFIEATNHNSHQKSNPILNQKQLQNMVTRYFKDTNWNKVKSKVFEIKENRNQEYEPISLVQALKSKDKLDAPEILLQKYEELRLKRNNSEQPSLSFQKNSEQISQQIHQWTTKINEEMSNTNIRIQQNHYIYISTIFFQINFKRCSNSRPELLKRQSYDSIGAQKRSVNEMVDKFKKFLDRMIIFHSQELISSSIKQIRQITHTSLKLAMICYIQKEANLFEQHLLNCERFHAMIFAICCDQLKNKNNKEYFKLENILREFHLRIMLSLYSFYSENKARLNEEVESKKKKQDIATFAKKYEIIVQQLKKEYDKNDGTTTSDNLKCLFVLDKIAQQLHYANRYNFIHHLSQKDRRQSNAGQLSYQDVNFKQSTQNIDVHHTKIVEYWSNCKRLQQIQKSPFSKDNPTLLSKDSKHLLLLIFMKLIYFNLSQLQQLPSKYDSQLHLSRLEYITLYIEVIKKITQQIFTNKLQHGIFGFQEHQSIKVLYMSYLKNYITVYFRLQKQRQAIVRDYSLKIYHQLIQLCEQTTVTVLDSLKKMIEMHVSQQFFNTWTIRTYISIPLIKEINQKERKCNIKRYQQHIYRFQHHLINHQIDKKINLQFRLLNQDSLIEQSDKKKCQNSNRDLIQLMVGDYQDSKTQYSRMLTQNCTGKLEYKRIRQLRLPEAPIVIAFGVKAELLSSSYQNSNSVLIWISVNYDREESQWKHLSKIQKQAGLLQIYYSILQFFYCSFCRHLFSGDYIYFWQQFCNSFHLAKAQAMIKTKIRFSYKPQFSSNKLIQKIIQSIDSNIKMFQSQDKFRTRPAYHFIYKCGKSSVRDLSLMEKGEFHSQIGGNSQISQILDEILRKTYQNVNILIYYKSQEMFKSFVRSLRAKLRKLNKFTVKQRIITETNYDQFYKSMFKQIDSVEQAHQQKRIYFFHNLTEDQFITECSNNIKKQCKIKLFFAKKQYQSKQCNKRVFIQEQPDKNKSQFQYYLAERMMQSNLQQKVKAKIIKKSMENPSSFDKIKEEVAKESNRHQ